MIRKKIIVFLKTFQETTTDYQQQTISVLKKTNTVFVINLGKKESGKRLKKVDGVYYFQPFIFLFLPDNTLFLKVKHYFNLLYLLIFSIFSISNFWTRERILWIVSPDSYQVFQSYTLFFHFTLFDMVDYLENNKNREYYRKFLSQVDLIAVNSQTLYKIYSKENKNIKVVPQGFRANTFGKAVNKTRGEKIGYIGGINSRLDYKLLIQLIQRNPQWTFTLCGPIYDYKSQQGQLITTLTNLPNVECLGETKKENIPQILSTFRIGIIPYDMDYPFNQYCYPMKLFEYFYQGMPVISTPIEELRQFPHLVMIGRNVSEWEKIIKDLLRKPWPSEKKAQQRLLAEQNSWENKIEAIGKAIEEIQKK